MVPVKFLMLEDEIGDQSKHHQRDALLDHLQLHKIERAAIIHKADAVGRHLGPPLSTKPMRLAGT